MTSPGALVNKVWNYAHVLRDDGVSYGDYVEQITCLPFLKTDQERHDHLGEVSRIPAEWCWQRLNHPESLIGVELVTGPLFEGRTETGRLRLVVVDDEGDAYVIFPPPEDMIADRLGQHASDPHGRDDMLEQARLLASLAEGLDLAYLKRRIAEEGADPAILELLKVDRSEQADAGVLKLREEAKRIEARMRAFGLDRACAATPRNLGIARSPAKRQLLRAIEEAARRQGRTRPFAAKV